MCGLFGFYSNNELITEVSATRLSLSLEAISHRGPDNQGVYISRRKKTFLSHARLSINDLSPAGSQPLTKDHLTIVFNGEIYNFKEIKNDLTLNYDVSFSSHSDTEVILALYLLYKEKCVNYLVGMFSFAIYDELEDELFLARDHLGEKPLVYSEREDGFYFCSEIPGILKTSQNFIAPRLDLEFIIGAGNHRHVPDPFTMWENVYRLKPAHFMLVKNGRIQKLQQFWRPNISSSKFPSQNLRDLVIKSVEMTTVSDVPFTILLSGGIDSSIIAHILKRELGKDIEAFVYGKDNHDEEVLRAQKVARVLDIPLKVITQKQTNLEDFNNVIKYYGEPLPLLPLLYNISIMKAVREQGYKVIITGNGADEIFYGYTGHINTYKRTKNLDFLPRNTKQKVFKITKFLNNYRFGTFDQLRILKSWFEDLTRDFPKFDSYIDFSNYFGLLYENAHSITISSDIASTFYGLEQRSPFLNKDLVEACFNTKAIDKISANGSYSLKHLLKEAFRDSLPEEVFTKPKIGFGYYSKESTFGMTRETFIADEFKRWRKVYNI